MGSGNNTELLQGIFIIDLALDYSICPTCSTVVQAEKCSVCVKMVEVYFPGV